MNAIEKVKIHCFIKAHKLRSNGEAPIFVRITLNGERAEFGTKRSISPNLWNEQICRAKGKTEVAININWELDKICNRIEMIQQFLEQDGIEVTAMNIKDRLLGVKNRSRTVIQVFEEHNRKARQLIGKDFAELTVIRYETTLDHFRRFLRSHLKRDDISFRELTPHVLDQFEHYFKVDRNCSHNTTMKYLKNFKKIVRIALANNWLKKDPFANKSLKEKPVDPVFLTQEELDLMINTQLHKPRLEAVRDVFLFCCYTGLAFTDVKSLEKEQITTDVSGVTWIHKKRQKSKQMSTILVLKAARALILKYEDHPRVACGNKLLPVPSNQKMNNYLKEIASLCQINKKLTSHVARHTFGTTVAMDNNIPLEVISKVLGHSNIRMTQRYARVTENLVKREMAKLDEIY